MNDMQNMNQYDTQPMHQSYGEVDNNEPEEKKSGLSTVLKWLLIIIIIIIIILLLLKSCGCNNNSNLEGDLLNAGKKYYETNNKPQIRGTCDTVTLGELIEKNLLKENQYSNCDKNNTYVKVCLLESGSYHYAPVLSCPKEEEYTDWKKGIEADVIPDKTYLAVPNNTHIKKETNPFTSF